MRRTAGSLSLFLAMAVVACGGGGGGHPAAPDPMTDFRLPDVNPASATSGAEVSVRDELGKVSAWYFGHST